MTRRGALSVLSGHTFVYAAGYFANGVAVFLLLPLFTRRLTPAEYGLLALTGTTIELLGQVFSLQLDNAMARRYLGTDDPARRRKVVGTAFATLVTLTAIVCLALVGFAQPIAALLLGDAGHAPLVRWMAAILAATVLTECVLAILKAERRSIAVTGWQLVRLVAELTLKILLVVVVGRGVLGVLEGQAVADLVFLGGAAAWLVYRFGFAFDGAELKSLVRYSAPLVPVGLCQFALQHADKFLFRKFSSTSELGLYDVAYKFGHAPTDVVLAAFLLVWYPYVFALRDAGERRRLMSYAALLVPALLVLVSLPVALLAPEIVRLLTDVDFHVAWRSIPVLAFAYVFWGLYQVIQTPFYVHERTAAVPLVVAAAAAIQLTATALLIPRLGAVGAALAAIVGLAALALVTRLVVRRIEPVPIAWGRLAGLLVPCAAAGLALYAVPIESSFSLPARLATLVLAAAWIGFAFLQREERDRLRALFTRNRPEAP